MRIDRFHRLAVKRAAARRAAARKPHCDRTGDIRAPEHRRGLVDYLIERHRGKICELHFQNRPHAFKSRADRQTRHRIFADR